MAYQQDTGDTFFERDPIRAQAEDWFYFTLGSVDDADGNQISPGYLETGESVFGTPTVNIANGSLLEGPSAYSSRVEGATGWTHNTVYGARIQAGTANVDMRIELQFSTTASRNDIRRAIVVRVLP